MRRIFVLAALLVAVLTLASTAGAVIHEQVAAYCSGGGHGAIGDNGFLEPPGIADPTERNFAQPVLSNGVVVLTATGPVVTDAPAAKFPAGSDPRTMVASDADHPSTHCQAMRP